MSYRMALSGGVAAALILVAGVTSAATFSVVGGDAAALPSNFSLSSPTYTALSGGVGAVASPITVLTGATKNDTNGLSLNGGSRLTVTYLGSEAGFKNIFSYSGAEIFANKTSTVGEVSTTFAATAGFVPFSFRSRNIDEAANDGAISPGVQLAFSEVFNNGRSILAFFDDKTKDIDYDDMAVRIDLIPIPLPAAGWMFFAALGGIAILSRRRSFA